MQQRVSIRWVLALVALAAHMSTVVHSTVVTHVRCEHGEWVEVGTNAGSATSLDELRGLAVEPGAHHHEHCLAARVGGSKPNVSREVLVAPQSANVVLRKGRQERTADQRRLCLLLAPKASPPQPSV